MTQETCKERVNAHFKSRMDDLRKLWRAEQAGYEGGELDPVEKMCECPICQSDDAISYDNQTDICRSCFDELTNLGTFREYGLAFDYVPEDTFGEQKEAYFRYQLSWGGPSDEFRLYVNPSFNVHRIEYWFLDWFDGASIKLEGEDFEVLDEIYKDFNSIGMVSSAYDEAKEV